MHVIFTYIYPIDNPNVDRYSIHGAYGYPHYLVFFFASGLMGSGYKLHRASENHPDGPSIGFPRDEP